MLGLASSPSHASPTSAGDLNRRWKQDAIRICFAKPEQTKLLLRSARYREYQSQISVENIGLSQTENLKNVLLTAYPKELTGIELQGFDYCTGASDEPVDSYFSAIHFRERDWSTGLSSVGDEKSYPGALRSGPQSARSFTGLDFESIKHNLDGNHADFLNLLSPLIKGGLSKRERILFQKRVTAQILALTAIHEFGHVLGLRHEDARSDLTSARALDLARRYSFCKNDWKSDERERDSDSLTRDYDLFSVMNYRQADMIQLYQRARFVCTLRDRFDWSRAHRIGQREKTKAAIQKLIESCPFVEAHPFTAGLSEGDEEGLRTLYSLPGNFLESTSQKNRVPSQDWIRFFEQVQTLDPAR